MQCLVAQVDSAFEALRVDREDVGLADLAVFLDLEHLGREGVVGELHDALAIEIEALNRRQLDAAVEIDVVRPPPFMLEAVQFLEGGKLRMEGEEAVAKAAEVTLNFAFGRAVAYRRVGEHDVQPQTGFGDFTGTVVGAVVDRRASLPRLYTALRNACTMFSVSSMKAIRKVFRH